MIIVKIMLDFLHSPIWAYEDGLVGDEPEVIANDESLQRWCNQVMEMYSSYYEFDSHDEACWFNEKKEREEKETMLSLIHNIIERLSEINDGSYTVEDYVTAELSAL